MNEQHCPKSVDGNEQCRSECKQYNFGALAQLPLGYSVWWHDEPGYYQAHGPGGWSSKITVWPYNARMWCIDHYHSGMPASMEP